jgi:nitrogen-specific signal transduction histidine kinase
MSTRHRAPEPGAPGASTLSPLDPAGQAEAEIERLRRELDTANQSVGARARWLSHVGHEIRTPMNAILGFTRLLLESEEDPKRIEHLQLIWTSGDALLTLVNDLLDHSRITSGRMKLEAIPFDLANALDDIVRTMSLYRDHSELAISLAVDAGIPQRVVGDPGRLRQVVVNLVGNAVKFTSSGEVTVSARVQQRAGDQLILLVSVADTGIGISPDDHARIFEPFEKLGDERGEGTGLGLAIAAQLVELMGGDIWLDSTPEIGSVFYFTVPVSEAPPLQDETPVVDAFPFVIHVSDRPAQLRGDDFGGELIEAEALGRESAVAAAYGELRLHPGAVVLFDLRRDALSSATDLAQMVPRAAKRIVAITPAGHRGDAASCRELGLGAYLTDRPSTQDLAEAIRLVAAGHGELVTRHTLRERRSRG